MNQVTAAIIEKNGEILIAKRKEGKHKGKWEFPGGKIEVGESPEECLKRELNEEFNIETKIGPFLYSSKFVYDHISIELLAYKTYYISGDFKLNDHEEINWVSPKDFMQYDFLEADKPIVKRLMEGRIK